MKRDMDLVRSILLVVENEPGGFVRSNLSIAGYSETVIWYHCYIMGQAGLLEIAITTDLESTGPEALPQNLTWFGHEFLDAAREATRWEKAREMIRDAGGASIQVWMDILTDLVKKGVGLQ